MVDLMIVLFAVGGLSCIAAILVARSVQAARWRQGLVTYTLRFPRDLEPEAVTAFITTLSGLVAPRWQRAVAVRSVMVETTATVAGIEHHLVAASADAPQVLAALRAALPGVIVSVEENYRPVHPMRSLELGLTSTRRLLEVSRPVAIASNVLAAMQPLQRGEHLVVQWSLRLVGPPALVAAAVSRPAQPTLADWLWDLWTAPDYDRETVAAARAKQSRPVFVATGRLGVRSYDAVRRQQLLAGLRAAYQTVSAPGVQVYSRRLSSEVISRAMVERRLPIVTYPCVLNAAELAALVAFPVGAAALLPGVQVGGCRPLAPAADIPAAGRVVAEATFPGAERPLALSVAASLRHLHLVGPTGSGKSTTILNLVIQDIEAGRGVVVVDPKGDLVTDVLDRIPANRISDVVVLDPTDEDRPVGLNLLEGSQRSPEMVAEQVVSIFHQLYRSSWGPRTEDVLRSAILTLAEVPDMTLAEVPLLLTDAGFRRRLVGRVSDRIALGPFWSWYENLSEAERAQVVSPLLNKVRAFLLRQRVRNVIGQARPGLDIDQALAQRQILLVPLSKGLLGEEAAALLGSLVVARVWQSVQRRAALAPEQRPTTFCFIDEFQDYLNLPMGIADVLAQARALGLGLILAHKHLGQLPGSIRDAVLANARSRIIWQLGAGDARVLARELAPHLQPADLQGLGPYEVVATLSTGTRVAAPVTGRTRPPAAVTGHGEAARAASRKRYGIERTEIEKSLRERHEGRPGPGGIGRREVSS